MFSKLKFFILNYMVNFFIILKLSDPEQNASALEFQKTFVHLMLDSSPHNLSTGIFHRSGRDLFTFNFKIKN